MVSISLLAAKTAQPSWWSGVVGSVYSSFTSFFLGLCPHRALPCRLCPDKRFHTDHICAGLLVQGIPKQRQAMPRHKSLALLTRTDMEPINNRKMISRAVQPIKIIIEIDALRKNLWTTVKPETENFRRFFHCLPGLLRAFSWYYQQLWLIRWPLGFMCIPSKLSQLTLLGNNIKSMGHIQ